MVRRNRRSNRRTRKYGWLAVIRELAYSPKGNKEHNKLVVAGITNDEYEYEQTTASGIVCVWMCAVVRWLTERLRWKLLWSGGSSKLSMHSASPAAAARFPLVAEDGNRTIVVSTPEKRLSYLRIRVRVLSQ